MNRSEFCVKYAKENNISQASAERICESVLDLLSRSIANEERVYIMGLGTFKKKMTKPHRIGSLNGGVVELPPKEKIVFIPTEKISK